MGVEHALFCKKCKTWVDGHKNWALYYTIHEFWDDKASAYVTRPQTWDESKEQGRFSWYWSQRMFAFLWGHKDHGAEVEWLTDGGDEYYDRTCGEGTEWKEEFPRNNEEEEEKSPPRTESEKKE